MLATLVAPEATFYATGATFYAPYPTLALNYPPTETKVVPTVPAVDFATPPKADMWVPAYPRPDVTVPKTYDFLSYKFLGGFCLSNGYSSINDKCFYLYQLAQDVLYFNLSSNAST